MLSLSATMPTKARVVLFFLGTLATDYASIMCVQSMIFEGPPLIPYGFLEAITKPLPDAITLTRLQQKRRAQEMKKLAAEDVQEDKKRQEQRNIVAEAKTNALYKMQEAGKKFTKLFNSLKLIVRDSNSNSLTDTQKQKFMNDAEAIDKDLKDAEAAFHCLEPSPRAFSQAQIYHNALDYTRKKVSHLSSLWEQNSTCDLEWQLQAIAAAHNELFLRSAYDRRVAEQAKEGLIKVQEQVNKLGMQNPIQPLATGNNVSSQGVVTYQETEMNEDVTSAVYYYTFDEKQINSVDHDLFMSCREKIKFISESGCSARIMQTKIPAEQAQDTNFCNGIERANKILRSLSFEKQTGTENNNENTINITIVKNDYFLAQDIERTNDNCSFPPIRDIKKIIDDAVHEFGELIYDIGETSHTDHDKK